MNLFTENMFNIRNFMQQTVMSFLLKQQKVKKNAKKLTEVKYLA